MPRVATEYSCPTCKKEGKRSQIAAEDGRIVCMSGNPAHIWDDSMKFRDLAPDKDFNAAPPMIAQQVNRADMKVTVPAAVKEKLTTKYAGRLEITVAGFLEMLSEGEVLVIPASDLERMKQRFGVRPETAGEIFGLVFSATQDKDTAELQAKVATDKLEAYEKGKPGWVAIDLAEFWDQAAARAADSSEPVDFWCQRNIRNGIENSWF